MTHDTDTEALAALDRRYARVLAAIDAACARAGRSPDEVTLVAASKTVAPEVLGHLVARGHRVFGENRVQEAAAKWPRVRPALPRELRLIGPLQTNKVRDAVRSFDVIESVDREKLVAALGREQDAQGRAVRMLVQVNIGGEQQKSGCPVERADALIERARGHYGLAVDGIMGIPPHGTDPRPHFRSLAAIARRNGLGVVSMGMSGDFDVAIAEGATHVRVGSAVFGPRVPPSDRPAATGAHR
ncbi:YggS family pyridoxal phosphate-dependent enzyme [Pseudonocardia sp. HH130630-07]|uniref:YggS family pyridoxal phosphate-dependent enzyme n=1 Tax=Pseudonocardia sp. HH130630-07 TaxID=1690815 RepID=UPI0008153BF3|nr:YggS family pyridoxal phosphate-dependent enzyme [Pseudonocardia sp. HH130630-07]ANY08059.1 hypothetical protein AFB00_19155 [Pseudonocardia sp. HH130630-07]